MKKFLALILAAAMILVFVSCGKDEPEDTTGKADTTADTKEPEDTTAPEDSTGSGDPEIPVAASALDVLNKIWNSFDEDEKFPAIGGDFSEENLTDNAPGKYSIEDAEVLDSALGIPQDSVALIDEAASLMHMMNANLFTSASYHVKNSTDVAALAASIKDNILNRRWMCGFPDTLVVISVGDYVVSAFGNEEVIESFKTKTLAAFDGAKLLYEEPLA